MIDGSYALAGAGQVDWVVVRRLWLGSLLAKRFAGRSIQIALSLVLLLAGGKMFA